MFWRSCCCGPETLIVVGHAWCRNRVYLRDEFGEKIPLDEPDEEGQEFEWEWQDGCVSRLDPDTGEVWWTVGLGMGQQEFVYPYSIRIDSDGYAYVAFIEPYNYAGNGFDYRVQYYDPDNLPEDKPYNISTSGTGSYSSPFSSFNDIYTRTDITGNEKNGVAKINSEGKIIWQLYFLAPSQLRPTSNIFTGAVVPPFRSGDIDIKADDDTVIWVGCQRDKNGVFLKRLTPNGEIVQRLRARDMWEHGSTNNLQAPGTTTVCKLRIDRNGNLYVLPNNTYFKYINNGSPVSFTGQAGLKYINPATGEILWYGKPHTASDGTIFGKNDFTPSVGYEVSVKFPFGLNDVTANQNTLAFEYDWATDKIYASAFSSAISEASQWTMLLSRPWLWTYKLTDYVPSMRYWFPRTEPNMVIDCFFSPDPRFTVAEQAKWFFEVPFEIPLSTSIDEVHFPTSNVWWLHYCCRSCFWGLDCGWYGGYSGHFPRDIVVDGAERVVLATKGAQTHEVNPTFHLERVFFWGVHSCHVSKSDQWASGYWPKCMAFDLLGGTATVLKCIEEDPYFFDNGGHVKYTDNSARNIAYMTNGVDRGETFLICHFDNKTVPVETEETLYTTRTNADGTFDTINCCASFSLATSLFGVAWSMQMGWNHEFRSKQISGPPNPLPWAQNEYTGNKKPALGLCGDIRSVEIDKNQLEEERDIETLELFEDDPTPEYTDDGT